jgi:archaeosortase A (PGF-CTERM-specific)
MLFKKVVLLELGMEFRILMDMILLIGLLFLGFGFYKKTNRCHMFRMLGLILFGIFWVLQTPYFISLGDIFNAVICILALPFYAFLGYHEYLSFERREEVKSLKWIVGASFFAGGLYFLVDKVPLFSGVIIYIVAVHTVWLLNSFGYSYGIGDVNYVDNPLWYRTNYNEIQVPIEGSSVAIIQSCTAIQSMLIFIAAIYCIQAVSKRKWFAFFATVPVIYVLNLFRNVGVIYMMDELGWNYETAHHTVGKAGSFLALIALAVIAFKLLPELLDNIWGLVDLKDRDKKLMEKQAKEDKMGLKEDSEEETEPILDEEGERGDKITNEEGRSMEEPIEGEMEPTSDEEGEKGNELPDGEQRSMEETKDEKEPMTVKGGDEVEK